MNGSFRGRLTLSVPEAGRLIYGIGRDAAYAAAERGEMPVRRVGRSLRVPTHEALRAVGLSDELIAMALGIDTLTGPLTAMDISSSSRAITGASA